MLGYAEKLSLNAAALTKADLDELRGYFSEQQVYDIVVIASLFNFIDRIADAFGVELDSFTQRVANAAPEGEALKEFAAARRDRASVRSGA
jgi:hypothetical protein